MGITMNVPDMETFNFSNGLEIVETMLEGVAGTYVEIDEQDYLYIFGKKSKFIKAVDDRVLPKDRVFLVRYTGNVRRAEKNLNKRFVKYPFSNSSPIDIVEKANTYVKGELDKCIDNIIQKSIKEVISKS